MIKLSTTALFATLLLGSLPLLEKTSTVGSIYSLTDASVQNAKALDTPIRQLIDHQQVDVSPLDTWLDQYNTSGSLTDLHGFEQFNGIGGPVEPAIGALDSDALTQELEPLNQQVGLARANELATGREDGDEDELGDLSQVLSERPRDKINAGHLLAAEPIANPRITSGFGYRSMGGGEFHKGMDFSAPTGTGILATGAGQVVFAGWMSGYGRLVEIDHGQGYRTRYAHASALFVKVGDMVEQGDRIAAVGSSGRSTGPHLHYEVRINGKATNPATYVAMAKR